MPLLSICIPVYNAEEYLDNCLRPLLQMGDDVEIILSDDGSTDNSLQICRDYAKNNSNIVVVTGENGGPSAARNRGIEKITGEYTIFCDADDWLEPETYSSVKNLTETYDVDFIQFGLYFCNGESKESLPLYYDETGPVSEDDFKDLLALTCGYRDDRNLPFPSFGLVTCKVYKTSMIKDLRFDPNVVGEDTLYALQAMKRVRKPYFLSERLYNYRFLENSYSRKLFPEITFKTIKFLNQLRDIFDIENTGDRKIVDAYYLRCYDFLLWSIRGEGYYEINSFAEKRALIKKTGENEVYKKAMKCLNVNLLNVKHRLFVFALRNKMWTAAVAALEIKK